MELNIPNHMKNTLFFPESITNLNINLHNSFELNVDLTNFGYDIAAHNDIDTIKPWLSIEQYIPIVIAKWKGIEPELTQHFQQRKKTNIKQAIDQSLGLFLSMLFWMNSSPVTNLINIQDQIKELKYKPINVGERIDFIMKKPHQFHSFIQLSELFQESTKIYYKIVALQK
ncbi:YpoC family protein [Bacillus sp. SCS-151]|uniref:YpoC family protein n=1 Tax=Nanhaiella sioensis TaxID=3115293 RepID=UPI0039796F6C